MSSSTTRPVLRFAPSPNGRLHLGHAYSALYTWNAARLLGGAVLLRIEDIDTDRSKPEFARAIEAALDLSPRGGKEIALEDAFR